MWRRTNAVVKRLLSGEGGRKRNSPLVRVGDVVLVDKRGVDLLNDPIFNKGTAFPIEERDRLGLRGLLPPRNGKSSKVDIQLQVKRFMQRHRKMKVPLNQYQHLMSTMDRNETLFYKIVLDHLPEMAPIIYTPTVGEACKQFGSIFRKARGMYFSVDDIGQMHSMVYNWPRDDVKLVVITDGSRILGLGDLGINGMGIPVGKLSLYVAAAGIHPSWVLPVMVDVGTNNEKLLKDELYLGVPQKRLKGDEYYQVMDEVLGAITERWPDVLIQFEDFSNEYALPMLDRYRERVLCFNDDIQGTGAVTSAAVMAAMHAIGKESRDICSAKIVIAGAGSAGVGIAQSIRYAMSRFGLSEELASKQFWLTDNKGLLGRGRLASNRMQDNFIRTDFANEMSLLDVVKSVKPDILIGVTGVGGLFTKEIVEAMSEGCERPFLFPLSNPTANAECTAEQAFTWSKGKALYASGSPFDPVQIDGRTYYPNQANNMYTFPGIGLGAILCGAKIITENMLHAASLELSLQVSPRSLAEGKIFPEVSKIRDISLNVAVQVIRAAQDDGVSTKSLPRDLENLRRFVEEKMWLPSYGAVVYPYSQNWDGPRDGKFHL